MNNNPSPGNKAGGLTTILEKSLGAVAKGGTTNLVQVLEYAEPATAKGFVYMDTPGYDPVSATGQVAGGANMICFTTGRGSAYGCKPAPSLKLATNTALWEHQEEDMDINCGTIIDGKESVDAGRPQVLRPGAGDGLGQEDQVRAVRLRRGRVRALGTRRDDVAMRRGFLLAGFLLRMHRRVPRRGRKQVGGAQSLRRHRLSPGIPVVGPELRQGAGPRCERRSVETVRHGSNAKSSTSSRTAAPRWREGPKTFAAVSGATRDEAETKALRRCGERNAGKDCTPVAWACTR